MLITLYFKPNTKRKSKSFRKEDPPAGYSNPMQNPDPKEKIHRSINKQEAIITKSKAAINTPEVPLPLRVVPPWAPFSKPPAQDSPTQQMHTPYKF